jgi:hypothetical protein
MQNKPRLSFWQIWNMSFGFMGIQIGFGLQQANMSPIYKYLGAEESSLPYLWLAGPVTGLLIQPVVGAMSGPNLESARAPSSVFFNRRDCLEHLSAFNAVFVGALDGGESFMDFRREH